MSKRTISSEASPFTTAETVWDELFARADLLTAIGERRGQDEQVARRLQSEMRVRDSWLDYGEDCDLEITKADTPSALRLSGRVLPSLFANDEDEVTKPGIPPEVFALYKLTA